ncbi:MAG: hypothetical protein JW735_06525 [Prolixibacteraceae bacterium]|nr:hypothetical protein [Prolixibacteraceae bacterium]
MVRKIFFSLLFVSFFIATKANPADSLHLNNIGVTVGYWGTPAKTTGFQLGLQKYQLNTEKFKILTNCDLVVEKRTNSYSSFGVLLSSGVRRTFKFGLFLEYNIKSGYIGSYYTFDLYKVNSNGDVMNIGKKIYHTFVFGNSFGFGYDFYTTTKMNLQLFVKPVLYYRYPNLDNPFYLNNFGLEAGIIFHPSFYNKKN